jgi:restriction system protein
MDVYNCNFIKTDCKDKILSNRISVKDIDVSDEIEQAIKVVIETGQASTSMIQRRLNIGYARAGRMIDDMETLGVVGPHQGARPRDVLMTYIDWVNLPKKYYYKPYDIVENKKEIKQYNDLEYIDNELDGYGFESYCSELLKKNGFQDTKVTKASNDYGADIIAVKEGVRYAIQCKKYSNPVGITAIQEVIASKSIYDCHVAVVLTNSTFTNNAIELANKNGVLLWDRTYLSKLIQKN